MQSQPQSQSQPHPPPSAAQLARLAEKKKEFEAVDALQRSSALFLRRLEGLADDCETMADAGISACPGFHLLLFFALLISVCRRSRRSKPLIVNRHPPLSSSIVFYDQVHGQVLAQWPQMFRILNT